MKIFTRKNQYIFKRFVHIFGLENIYWIKPLSGSKTDSEVTACIYHVVLVNISHHLLNGRLTSSWYCGIAGWSSLDDASDIVLYVIQIYELSCCMLELTWSWKFLGSHSWLTCLIWEGTVFNHSPLIPGLTIIFICYDIGDDIKPEIIWEEVRKFNKALVSHVAQ